MDQFALVFPRTEIGLQALYAAQDALSRFASELQPQVNLDIAPTEQAWLLMKGTIEHVRSLISSFEALWEEEPDTLAFQPYLIRLRSVGKASLSSSDTLLLTSEEIYDLSRREVSFRDALEHEDNLHAVDRDTRVVPQRANERDSHKAAPNSPRLLQGRSPQRVNLNRQFLVEVRIAMQPSTGTQLPSVPIALPVEGGEVLVGLHAPGFTTHADEDAMKFLRVPAQGDSVWLPFLLVANRPGKQKIEVTGYFGNAYLGTLTLEIQVGSGVTNGPSQTATLPVKMRQREAGEVNLEIRRTGDTYTFRVIENNFPYEEWQSQPLTRSPQAAVEGLVAQLNKLAQGGFSFSDASVTRNWLRGQGVRLWQEFVPQPLRDFFWQRKADITRLTILAKDDAVPWELLYPIGPRDEDEGFLQETIELARWTFGSPPPSILTLREPRFVLPQGGPPSAISEIERLLEIIPNATAPIGTLVELLDALRGGHFDLLHFACHNRFVAQQAADSYIEMDGKQPFSTVFLAGQPSWQQRMPLVFFNACRSAGEGSSYTRPTGWASQFLAAGAGAFIGSLWEVRDNSASAFAEAFYDALCGGQTMGVSLKAGRNAIKDRSGDPTWLAYAFYGDPAATLHLDQLETR